MYEGLRNNVSSYYSVKKKKKNDSLCLVKSKTLSVSCYIENFKINFTVHKF